MSDMGLNAPDGAGCFPTYDIWKEVADEIVSMHLMVLGASRRRQWCAGETRRLVSMHLMVLGASRPSACCPLSRLGKRAPDRHRPESAPWTGSHTAH